MLTRNLQGAANAAPQGWDISTASIELYGFLNVAPQDAAPQGIFFKPDGTKMYFVGNTGNDVNEYDLSTPWEILTASYVQNFSVAAQDTWPLDLYFSPDGTKMYIAGNDGDDVNEYTLSSAWDISTASYVQNFSVAAQETNPNGLYFSPDGTKMYIVGQVGDDVNEYTLSSAWDISTASYVQNFSVGAQETVPHAITFKPDGTKMYVVGHTGDDVNEYTLSSAWDVSTASYAQNFSDPLVPLAEPSGLFFKPDGTRMYIIDAVRRAVYGYNLSSAWDISSAAYDAPPNLVVAPQELTPTDLFFKPDGTKLYIIGDDGEEVNEYTLSSAWDVTTASYTQNFSVAARDQSPNGLFFKPDGTKMYIVGNANDNVVDYDLSSAWDISTASYVRQFFIGSQETGPQGLFFKPDGTKMYVVGSSGDDINEYTLSSAWDISTASYVQNFSVAAQETIPQGLFFKSDGTKMYITGQAGAAVNEYTLSSAWDINTASYVQNFSVSAQDTVPRGVAFKPDGTKMYVLGGFSRAVWMYDL